MNNNAKSILSVLLSVYIKEKPAYLRQCLDSLFSQSLMPDEIVLVKDGPLTAELNVVIEEYYFKHPAIFKIIELEVNHGLGKALNETLQYCSCDIVARMDTDDIAKPDRFKKQMAILQENKDIAVVGSWVDEFWNDDKENIVSVRKLPEFSNDIYTFAKRRNPINHPTAMFRKRAVLTVGGYLHFPLFEDYFLWIRMLVNGNNFYNIPESLLYFRMSQNVYKRRGGLNYALNECKLRKVMLNLGLISNIGCSI